MSQQTTNAHKRSQTLTNAHKRSQPLTNAAMGPIKTQDLRPGDRVLYKSEEPCRLRVVTIHNINKNVPVEEEYDISIRVGPDGPIRETVLSHLLLHINKHCQ